MKTGNLALKIAKLIRIISIPPVTVTALLLILYNARDDIFRNIPDFIIALVALAIFPVLAYPLSYLIFRDKEKRRDKQRKLSFVFSAVGYTGGWCYGQFSGAGAILKMIFATYLFSVIILIIFNALIKIKASGHACSVSGPIVLVSVLCGWFAAIFGAVLWAAIFWASLVTKRHTVSQFILGSLTVVVALGVSYLIYL